ncbi:hypothetical protein HN014_13755 [Aquimarina sp. TRL1]|uniref:hypothetical protein n=1 Tax=Aquimarina sp. (strain TRL1) TaxID=2736252 RepID=UPI00158955BB|nr:hypothetical protein [Aquimarina sp. TRL1]QKX05925.1 hypothetical protein HN014_13755 [Aquimarina sp. TRL1]
MPANPKYLTTSNWQRFAKISSGILGGYFVAAAIHVAIAYWVPDFKAVLITSIYSMYLLWVALIIVPFWAKNGWKVWGVYTLVFFICSIAIYLGKMYYPIV